MNSPTAPRTPDAFLTAVSVLDSLVRAGMREAVLAPGSRSAPLAYALAALEEAGALRVHVRTDERSAGFLALGLAKASGRPVGVVTTSGTAVGELMPAVMEANHAEVPLAVLSADRPPRLRGTGANQTTWQPGIFGVQVRAAVDLTSWPEDEPGTQTAGLDDCLCALTGRTPGDWAAPADRPRGPVQINLAFDEPLTPSARMRQTLRTWAGTLVGLPEEAPLRREDPTAATTLAAGAEAGAAGDAAVPERRMVVVAGDGAGPVAEAFARSRNLPLLAEPSSGARFGPQAVQAYRLLLGTSLGEGIERVVLFGRPTLSRPVTRLLARTDLETAIYLPRTVAWADPERRAERPLATLAEAAEFAGRGAPGWAEAWRAADARLTAALEAGIAARAGSGVLDGLAVAREVWSACGRDGAALVSGSSNPVRDLDLMPAPRGPERPAGSLLGSRVGTEIESVDGTGAGTRVPRVFANRGLAGIDGTVSTAAGVSLGLGRPVRLLLGDLTFLHDVGSLLLNPGEREPDLQVVVFNDAGGGLFSTLEHGAVAREDAEWAAAVERFFGTPQAADLELLVRGYGHPYRRAETTEQLREALAEPVRGISVVEVRGARADRDGRAEDQMRLARDAVALD